MRLNGGIHFSYCLNVHPGESLQDVRNAITTPVTEIRKTLCPDAPFGLGLRLARAAATELLDPGVLRDFRDFLHRQNLYAFSINGFPYGAFHRTRVKENVYLPDWSSPERLAYTRDLFDLLSFLLPDDIEGSVSSVPLGYKGKWSPGGPELWNTFFPPLLSLARHLAQIEAETGKCLHLGLEPEPDCLLETTPETLAFFEALFQHAGADETLIRRHIGVCFDTCHVAMQFEDPAESLRAYTHAGIRVSKVQLSAALECNAASVSTEALRAFDDGVYLHQIKSDSGKAWRDLPEALAKLDRDAGTLRIHAHVPLHWPGGMGLRSTRPTLTPAFWQALRESDCRHVEVETYTFDVLPSELRQGRGISEDMIQECHWALEQLQP